MASSFLQNSQKAMELDDIISSPKQPPKTPELDQQTNLYACFNPSALSLLAPQLLANQTAAAAALMASWPIQLRAQLASSIGLPTPTSPFFPPGWPMTPPLSHKSMTNSPPPSSPLSPILQQQHSSNKKLSKLNINNNYVNNNNHIVVSTTSDLMLKKTNKKKQIESKNDHAVPGSLSPPTSSSSPQSNNSADFASSTRDPSKDKVFTCKICNRSFGYKHVLQNHERTHTGEKPFECSECHKRFTRDHHLKTHMRLHTGEKPYSCSHCDRQFVQVANLRRHLRVHTGEKPYNCEICNAKFSDSNQLKAHMLIHSGEKNFECEKCNARFRRRHHLMAHKCGASSISDQKSHVSDDESMEFKLLTNFKQDSDMPLNLSSTDNQLMNDFMKKFNESRVLQLPQINYVPTNLPEQTEPEDLSLAKGLHSPKSPDFDELDDLEDAATLYMKLQHKKQKKVL